MKLHQIFFWLLLFFLPVQLGKHFWPDFSFVLGLRVDYLSPTLYLTDFFVLAVLLFWAFDLKAARLTIKKFSLPLIILFFLLLNCFLAQNQGAAFYKLAKITIFAFLSFYVAQNPAAPSLIRASLPWAVIYSSLLAIAQLVKQAALGGPFYWLGERTFNAVTPGIAKAVVGGRLVMRPYATFPHPNALAGFLLVAFVLMKNPRNFREGSIQRLAMVLSFLAIVISFSRSVWLVGLLLLAFTVYRQRFKKRLLVLLPILICLILLVWFGKELSGREAIQQRLQLIKLAILMIKQNPLAGVGLNNFISQLPFSTGWRRLLQPVHNIFLLVAAETGLVGLMIFLWFLFLTTKRLLLTNRRTLMTAFTVILTLGLFDHYWFTLQQTQLLFSIILGLAWARVRK